MNDFLIRRVAAPSDATHEFPREALGNNPDWFWGVPGVFQALASPRSFSNVPVAPRDGEEHRGTLGYWTALHNLVLYRLGWRRPDRGLRWWYDNGKPTDDPTLSLIAEVWDRDGVLDHYVAWSIGRQRKYLNPQSDEFQQAAEDDILSASWTAWLRNMRESKDQNQFTWFDYESDGDTLHLTRSGGQRHTSDASATIFVTDRTKREAVFVTDRADAWYFTLMKHSKVLPDIGAQSWHVKVFVTSTGFVGTYRRSRATGLWFTGLHRVHSAGN